MKALVALGVCLLGVHEANGQTMAQAYGFLDRLYAYDTNDQADDPVADTKAYTAALIHLFAADQRRAKGNVGKLDFDPLCECQDPGGLHYVIAEPTAQRDGTARAQVSLTNASTASAWHKELTLDLLWTKQGWRINDVHSKRIPSLRVFLSER